MLRTIKEALKKRIPVSLRTSVGQLLAYAGEDVDAGDWVAGNIAFAFIISLALALMPFIFPQFLPSFIQIERLPPLAVGIFVVVAFVFALLAYFSLYYKIDERRALTDRVLPEFLSVVSMNIAAGMEPLTALYVSLRPDYEPVSGEMKKIRSLALGHKSVLDQLNMLRSRIDSRSLRTTIAVIERASRSGGNLAQLLESIAYDLREENRLQKELETATRGYVYFISFLILFGIPLLLSVSSVFIKLTTTGTGLTTGFASIFGINTVAPVPIAEKIDPLFLLLLVFSSFSASLMLGVLWRGEIKHGAKYIPFFIVLSTGSFFVVQGIVYNLMRSLGIL